MWAFKEKNPPNCSDLRQVEELSREKKKNGPTNFRHKSGSKNEVILSQKVFVCCVAIYNLTRLLILFQRIFFLPSGIVHNYVNGNLSSDLSPLYLTEKNLELAWAKSQSFIDWTSLVEKSWNHRVANSINARPLWAGLMNEYNSSTRLHLTKSTIHTLSKINKWIQRKKNDNELCYKVIIINPNNHPSNSSNDRFAQV